MADEGKAAREERAKGLREEIDRLAGGRPPGRPPQNPREFIDEQMSERASTDEDGDDAGGAATDDPGAAPTSPT